MKPFTFVLLAILSIPLSSGLTSAHADRIYPEPKARKGAESFLSGASSKALSLRAHLGTLIPALRNHVSQIGSPSLARMALHDAEEFYSESGEFLSSVGMYNAQQSISKLNDLYDAWTHSIRSYGDLYPTSDLVKQGYAASNKMQDILDYFHDYIIER